MYVVSDADRRDQESAGKVCERFYYRHEAYSFLDSCVDNGVDGVVIFEEKHWIHEDVEGGLAETAPFFTSGDAQGHMLILEHQFPKSNFYSEVELVRI